MEVHSQLTISQGDFERLAELSEYSVRSWSPDLKYLYVASVSCLQSNLWSSSEPSLHQANNNYSMNKDNYNS